MRTFLIFLVSAAAASPCAAQAPTSARPAPPAVEASLQPTPSDVVRKGGAFAGPRAEAAATGGLLDRDKAPAAPQPATTRVALSADDAGKPALAEPATAPALIPAADRTSPVQP
jgi:hypothetical protein